MEMQNLWKTYEEEVRTLRKRIAALRERLHDSTMPLTERQELEGRKRLLSEEARDMECAMADIAVYAEAEKAGEAACA